MVGWTTGTCKTNGIDVSYVRTGGDKPSVVLLHGLMTNAACWSPLVRALEENYDIVMPDARGHGNSDAPSYGYSYNQLADDVEGLIEAIGLDTPVLLGHSMGGMTAALVASRNSRQLRGLILVDPTFLTPQRQREVYESDIVDRHRQILSQSKEGFLAESLIRHSRRSRDFIELLAQARFQTSIHAFEVLTPPNPDYMQLISTIDVTSLLVIGDAGTVVSPEVSAEIAALNRHFKVAQVTEAGHGIPYDQPEQLAAVVKAFLHSLSFTLEHYSNKQIRL